MAAPVTVADETTVPGQANPNGPTQASVYNGPSAVPGVSARTLATLLTGETPIIGARRVDHADMVDYGFGADGIEYLLTTSAGVLIPDVAGLERIAVLANDTAGGTGDDDRINPASIVVSTAAAHGLAVPYQGAIWYAPFADYDGTDSFEYTVDSDGADTSAAAAVTVAVLAPSAVTPSPVAFSLSRGVTVTLDPTIAFASLGEDIFVQAVEITLAPIHGTATVVGRRVTYAAAADFTGDVRFSWRMLVNGIWTSAAQVRVTVGKPRRRATARSWPRRLTPRPAEGSADPVVIARADSSVTAENTAVTIAVLANDTGSNLTVLSVGAPGNGAAVANLDGTITYTPEAAFSGTDSFTYTITDGVSSSTAPVTVVVDPTGQTFFPNDYEAKGELWVAPDVETMTGFELLVDYTDQLLRSQANGGVVRNSSGHDIRCEDGEGNALDYCRISYSPTTGRWVALVKFDRVTGSVWSNLEIYAGKQGSVTDQADAAGALSGLLACWRMDTGADLTGNGRTLTVTGATASLLYGCPAARFDQVDDKAELADPSAWLDGLAGFTLSMDLQHDQIAADSGFYRIGGTATGLDSAAHMTSRAESDSFYANPAISNLYFALATVTVSGSPEICRIEGSANGVPIGVPATYALAWGSGGAWTIVADEIIQTPAYISPATQTGTLEVPGGPLAFGAGPRGFFGGTIGLVRVAAARRSNAWLQAEQRNRRRPSQILAKSQMILFGSSASPVAFPDTAAATGPDLIISPLANDTGTDITISAATATSGTVTIASPTTLLYQQAPGFAGIALISYTIRDSAGRTSSSIITVTVSGTPTSASNDMATTVATAPVVIPVLANDSGIGIEVVLVSNPPHGSAVISDGGSTVTYTADANFQGVDSFSYTIEDDAGQQRSATVAVTVTPPPIAAQNDSRTVVQGSPIDISVLANDTGTGLFVSAVTTPTNGTAARINGNTQVRYTSTPSFVGIATFNYTIQDSYGQSRTATVSVTVLDSTNPVNAVDNAYNATQGVATDLSVLDNDLPSTGLTISAVSTPSQGGSAVLINGNTQIRYTALANFAGTETFVYTATDGANTDIATVTMTVSPASSAFPKYPPTPSSNAKIRTVGYAAPSGGTTYNTGNLDADLTSALAAALPGDEIRLADGTYSAARTISRSGSATGGYIVIKSRNQLQAIVTTGSWIVSGDYVWLTGIRWQKPGIGFSAGSTASYYSIQSQGRNLRYTNNQFDSPNGIHIAANGISDTVQITWNTFTGATAPRYDTAYCIAIFDVAANSAGPNNITIARNKGTGDSAATVGSGAGGAISEDRAFFSSGNSEPGDNNTGNNPSVLITENFIEWNFIRRAFFMRRGYKLTRNFVRGLSTTTQAITIRHGGFSRADGSVFSGLTNAQRALIQGNNLDRGKMIINDTDHLIVSNRFANNLELSTGSANTTGGVRTQAASRNILVGNTISGQLRLGTKSTTSHVLAPTQGSPLTGVKNYANGITQPTGSNLVREDVEAGNTGYQEIAGDGGFTSFVQTFVARADLENSTGCDAGATGTAPTTQDVYDNLNAWWADILAGDYDGADTAAVDATINAYIANLIATGTPTTAVGDGVLNADGTVTGTDDRTALQNDLNNNAITVLAADKVYRIGASSQPAQQDGLLRIPPGKILVGRGVGSVLALGLKLNNRENPVIYTDVAQTGGTKLSDTVIANLTIDGTRNNQHRYGDSQENGGCHCLRTVNANKQLVLKCNLREADADGWYIGKDRTKSSNIYGWRNDLSRNRRNGSSVTGSTSAYFAHSIYRETGRHTVQGIVPANPSDPFISPTYNAQDTNPSQGGEQRDPDFGVYNNRGRRFGRRPGAGNDSEPNEAGPGMRGARWAFCTFRDNGVRGYVLDNRGEDAGADVKDCGIYRCLFRDNYQAATSNTEVRMATCPGTPMINCDVMECDMDTGQNLSIGGRQGSLGTVDATFTDCRFHNNRVRGNIDVSNTTTACSGNTIRNNRVDGSVDTPDGFTASGNGPSGTGPTGPVGVQAET